MLKSGSINCIKIVKCRPFLIAYIVETLKSGYFYRLKVNNYCYPTPPPPPLCQILATPATPPPLNFAEFGACPCFTIAGAQP